MGEGRGVRIRPNGKEQYDRRPSLGRELMVESAWVAIVRLFMICLVIIPKFI